MNPSTTTSGLRGPIAIGLCALLGVGLCAVAAADPGAASRTVRAADLDPSSASGAHALYRRIRGAAQVVCSSFFLATDADRARCVRDATADAVQRIDRPALTAVYEASYPAAAPGGLLSQRR